LFAQHLLDHAQEDLQHGGDVTRIALLNNAAITPPVRSCTPEGIELQFATNVLGYFWMTEALTPFLSQGSAAHIVNVVSYWAGGPDLEDLEFKRRHYQPKRHGLSAIETGGQDARYRLRRATATAGYPGKRLPPGRHQFHFE
jgi:NAD(P)-dependent dehydrogenase (short-subunit alcohol dehydrogenase family)